MDKVVSFVLVGFGGYNVIFSFIEDLAVGTLLGAEINIWLYRLIWSSVVVLGTLSIVKKFKQQHKE